MKQISNMARWGTREAAYHALLASFQGKGFISDYLEEWCKQAKPSVEDHRFAQELSYGCARKALTLDYLSVQLSDKKKLQVKLKERVLLRLGVYQVYFMSSVPIYAATDETVTLARKYSHPTFAGFLNAIMRKFSQFKPELP